MCREALHIREAGPLTSQYGMRSLRPEEVAAGLKVVVVSGPPGSALIIYPGLSFYWPDTNLAWFNLYCLVSRVLVEVLGAEGCNVLTLAC